MVKPDNATVDSTVVTKRPDFVGDHFQGINVRLVFVFLALGSGLDVQIVFMVKQLKSASFKVKLKKVLIKSVDSIVVIGRVGVDDEMIGEESVNFHEPVSIEGNSFADFACRQVL